MTDSHDIYLEIGRVKVFAGAIKWPGWCRSGRDEASAIQALFRAGPRYAGVLESTGLAFKAPGILTELRVVERLEGNSTTDFGAPDMPVSSDQDDLDAVGLERYHTILSASWLAFDKAVRMAEGKQLRKGPRGGGRDLMGIVGHVAGADVAYLSRLGLKVKEVDDLDVDQRLDRIRGGILSGLEASVEGHLPEKGPRGGKRWSPRFFIRRVTWHVIDHAWEIEDRII